MMPMMFIIELTYTADLARIDAAMRSHMQFINAHYASGHFVVSGRKIPRDGGIIVAIGRDRAEIEAIAQQDPFVTKGLATARVIEFRVSQRADDAGIRLARG
jgi:uncharacterized protein YciI